MTQVMILYSKVSNTALAFTVVAGHRFVVCFVSMSKTPSLGVAVNPINNFAGECYPCDQVLLGAP